MKKQARASTIAIAIINSEYRMAFFVPFWSSKNVASSFEKIKEKTGARPACAADAISPISNRHFWVWLCVDHTVIRMALEDGINLFSASISWSSCFCSIFSR